MRAAMACQLPPALGRTGRRTTAHSICSPGSPLVALCRALAARGLPARPCRHTCRPAAHRRLMRRPSLLRAAFDPRGTRCRPRQSRSRLLPRPATSAQTRLVGTSGGPALPPARRAARAGAPRGRVRRAGGCAGSSQQSGPQGGQAHLVQDCPLEDQVEQRGADSRVDRKRLAQLLHGFGDLPTRRGRRRGADYRLRSRQRRAFARVFAAGSSDGARARGHGARRAPAAARTVVSARNCVGRVRPSGPASRTVHSTRRAMMLVRRGV